MGVALGVVTIIVWFGCASLPEWIKRELLYYPFLLVQGGGQNQELLLQIISEVSNLLLHFFKHSFEYVDLSTRKQRLGFLVVSGNQIILMLKWDVMKTCIVIIQINIKSIILAFLIFFSIDLGRLNKNRYLWRTVRAFLVVSARTLHTKMSSNTFLARVVDSVGTRETSVMEGCVCVCVGGGEERQGLWVCVGGGRDKCDRVFCVWEG